MATEQVTSEMPRFSLLPLLLGMLEPADGDQEPPSERFVLINPFTQSMVVLHGGEGGVLAAMLGESAAPAGPPPASKASIEALRVVNPEEEPNEEAECAVCLEKLFNEQKEEAAAVVVKEMPCAHRYHGECVEKWLRMHGSCPMCRYKMPQEETEVKKSEEERREGANGNGVWVRISFGMREEGAAGDQRSSSTQESD